MSLKKNVIANYIGQGWQSLMAIAFVPFYIKYLGVESYGLIGVFTLLQVMLSLLDAGMSPALGREMARFTGGKLNAQYIRNLLRSIEIILLIVSTVIFVTVFSTSNWLAANWLNAEGLPIEEVSQALSIMGIIIGLRFVENIYRSSIIGLQKQVWLNIITVISSTLKGFGAVGVLAWVSPTIEAFFIWQAMLSLLTTILLAQAVYHEVPIGTQRARFSITALLNIWRFAGGMLFITFLSLMLTQIDKILLTKLLPLQEFGYYTLAAIVAGGLYVIVSPISQAFFPYFCKLVASQDHDILISSFHKGSQLVTIFMGSAAIVLIFFAEPILLLWTQDSVVVSNTKSLLIPLAIGNLLNGLMWIPYKMQLAYGWTSLTIQINAVSVISIIPIIFWAAQKYGAMGAAWTWVGLNTGYVLIGIHFMYRKILTTEKLRWYIEDILIPICTITVITGTFFWISHSVTTPLLLVFILVVTSLTAIIFGSIAASQIRSYFLNYCLRN